MVLDKSTGSDKVMCSSDCARDFLAAEEERGQVIETNFFKFMCGQ